MIYTETSHSFFKDKEGNLAIIAWPNVPIIGWAIFKLIALLVTKGRIHNGSEQLSMALLYTWAYLEITSGVNYFRRLLGLIVLSALVVGYFSVR
jgi:hypothetical protein